MRGIGVGVALLALACTSTPPPRSCDATATQGLCIDFVAGQTPMQEMNECLGLFRGAYSATTGCPSASRVGRCTTSTTIGISRVESGYGPMWTLDSLRAACLSVGMDPNATATFQAN